MARNKTLDEKIAAAKEKKEQYEKEMKRLLQQQNEQKNKARTKRLIERGAILEGQIADAEKLTNDQIKLFLEMTLQTDEARDALALVREQPADPAPEKPAAAHEQGGEATSPKPTGAAQNGGADGSGNVGGGARQAG